MRQSIQGTDRKKLEAQIERMEARGDMSFSTLRLKVEARAG